jgi:hypothetical protein
MGLVLLLGGCATGVSRDNGGRPDWVSGTSSEYPQSEYITGYGQATNLELAQDRARANIAKVFEVDIVEHSEDTEALEQHSDGETQQSQHDSRITRHLSTETRQIISGIEIADVWQPPEGDEYYVLAVLSRRQADTRLKRQIRTLDQDTDRAIARARNNDDALLSVRYAAAALAAQQERAAFQKIASVVDPSGRGIPPRWDVSRLSDDLNDLLARLHIEISSNGGDSETLNPLLAAAVTAAGMQVVDSGQGDYVIEGSLDITDLGYRDGWYWQRAALTIRLRDKADDRLRGTKTWDALKTAALDSALARQRLLDKVETTLKTEMRPAILAMVAP